MNSGAPYSGPVAQLLSIGEPSPNWEPGCYAALGISSKDVPQLIRMLEDASLHDAAGNTPLVWAPCHAWRALGELRAAEAVVPLVGLLRRVDDFDDDWVSSEIPEVLTQIGAAAVEPVAGCLADPSHGMWARYTASQALGEIGIAHPELRDRCIAILGAQLEQYGTQHGTFNGFLIAALLDLQAVELLPLFERAFHAHAVDLSVAGDLNDVKIELGMASDGLDQDRSYFQDGFEDPPAELRRETEAMEIQNSLLREMPDGLIEIPQPYIAPVKAGRNDPCPCGSGKKYKKCCGK